METTTVKSKRVSPADLAPEQRAEYERLKQIAMANRHLEGPPLPPPRSEELPFFVAELRVFIQQLKKAREAAGLTLAQVAEKTKLAEETLCRLESGAVTNPTWRTLGLYAVAVNLDLNLTATPAKRKRA